MANICDTTYKVTGPIEMMTDLWNALQELKVDEKNVWLGDLAKHFGIDYEKKHCSVRGEIYWAEYDDEVGLLSFDTETAWSACEEFFDELKHVFDDELSISFRETECGCGIYYVHDEGDFFPEECCVDCYGDIFYEEGQNVVETIEEAIDDWCEVMNINRDGRPQEEMVEFINDYEYNDPDAFYYIHPFTFN